MNATDTLLETALPLSAIPDEEIEGETEKTDVTDAPLVSLVLAMTKEAGGYRQICDYMPGALRYAGVVYADYRSSVWDCRLVIAPVMSAYVGPGNTVARDIVYHTMFEARPLPDTWVRVLNRTGGAWVPSHWCADVFRDSGVNVPIEVSGYGIDEVRFAVFPEVPGQEIKEDRPFRFLWVGTSLGDGEAIGGRKGGHLVVEAFQKLGLDNAVLLCKVNGDSKGFQALNNVPNVHVIARTLSWQEYSGLVSSADCLVYPSFGEGFGLIPLEAMACGVPVIATHYGGMTEYLSDEVAYTIPVTQETRATLYERRYGPGLYWAYVKVDDVADRMRWVYHHRDEAKAKGARAAEMAKGYRWQEAGEGGLAVLKRLIGRCRNR